MGREIITISIGGCGVSLGCKYWQQICQEHSVDYMGNYWGKDDEELQQIDVSFVEGVEKFVPRACFVDQDYNSFEILYSHNISCLFDREQVLFTNTDVQNNYAAVYCTPHGMKLANTVTKGLRKNIELCDSFHAFQILHACGGGVGSGMTSLLLERLKGEFPTCSLVTASVFEDASTCGHIVPSPLNTTLVTQKIIENSDFSICFDNVTLAHVCENKFLVANAQIYHLNDAICSLLTRFNSSVRFRGSLNATIRKIICNMVPFPRIRYIVGAYEPCALKKRDTFQNTDEHISTNLWPEFPFFNVDLSKGKFISVAFMFRGDWDNESCDRKITQFQHNKNYKFVNWIPRHLVSNLVKHPEPHIEYSAAFLANHTSFGEYFKNLEKQFDKMFENKANIHPFTHHYTKYGLSENAFYESSEVVKDIALEYENLNKKKG